MAITVDRLTNVISVPQADLDHVTGTLYECDTNWLRLQLKAIEASEEGIVEDDMHDHNTTYTVVGVTYARKIEIINGYSVQFTPNSQWSVRLAGSNNNLFDVEGGILQQNQVQVIAQNSAGLVVVSGESGLTEAGIADAVWDENVTDHLGGDKAGQYLSDAGGGASPSAIADAVWDESVTDHLGGSKAGEYVSGIKSKTDNLPTDPADQSLVEAAISTAESNIRGTDSDDLKAISDQVDSVAADVWSEILVGSDTAADFLSDILPSFVKDGNVKRELIEATEDDDVRNVAQGKLDHIVYWIKKDDDPDWSTADVRTLWCWYKNKGDDNPITLGEDG